MAVSSVTPHVVSNSPKNDEVITAIRRIAADLNVEHLSHAKYMECRVPSEPSGITAIRRFGTWKAAVTAAGLLSHPYSRGGEFRVSDLDALTKIRGAAAAYSSVTGNEAAKMTQNFYKRWRRDNGGLGLENLMKRYGHWIDVKRHAGLL